MLVEPDLIQAEVLLLVVQEALEDLVLMLERLIKVVEVVETELALVVQVAQVS
tara:strand:+ start:533 stop:691 length:159 start_codon:yes stop_codon:yes gene_type:complete